MTEGVVEMVEEGRLVFTFAAGARVIKYDEWDFYNRQFQSGFDAKGIDWILFYDGIVWFVEVTDYRLARLSAKNRVRSGALWREVVREFAHKIRDTVAGVATAGLGGGEEGKRLCGELFGAGKLCAVLHLEHADEGGYSELFEKRQDFANLEKDAARRLAPLTPHVRVMDMQRMRGSDLPWTVMEKRS